MRKRILITLPVALMVGFSLLALNVGIKKKLKSKISTKVVVQPKDTLKEGDIIFQTNISGQGKAIQLATKSKYTHVGILMKQEGSWFVYEAVQPVSKTPLDVFISTGDSGYYAIKRLKGSDTLLNMDKLARMRTYMITQLGKDYDPYFNWSDSTLYCSEFVWKCYRKAGIVLSDLRELKSFSLGSPLVQRTLKERYGNKIPYTEKVVSPGDIYESEKLEFISKAVQ
ncbi:MAG: YiiX family permuted papain-like enzyme [Bacteroidia bacterium]|nr:YiiX family permuted papain-like enzyme [Bacteroidia bacterium]